jgi:replicative DNA helicase
MNNDPSGSGDWARRGAGNPQHSQPADITDLLAKYVPPHDIEAEQAVLGAMLIDPTTVDRVADMLGQGDFYREAHQVLFDTIIAISARNEPIDPITVSSELRRRGQEEAIGGQAYLLALLDQTPTAAHAEHYARIVEEKAILRRLIEASMQIASLARSQETENVDDLIDQSERLIFNVSQKRVNQFFAPLSPLLLEAYERAEELNELKTAISGLPTGIHELDMITAGLQKSDMIIVAARPSMGKTSLCLSIAQHVAIRQKTTVAIFSLEMPKEQLALRMLCSEAKVSSHRVRTGYLNQEEWTRLADVVQRMYDAPIYIDDASDANTMSMRAKCRRLQAEHGLGLIIIDYLQLMTSNRRTENRVQEIGEIARGIKSLAREMGVPVIALSQLSRAVEHRDDKRPMLSDLRESGSIEAEADLVCFLYREAYYKMKEARQSADELDRAQGDEVEETEVIIGKHRNGPTGKIKVGFIPDFAKFVNLETRMEDGSTGF